MKLKNQHTYLNNEEDLLSFFNNKITQITPAEITIICAGHFMLIPSKNDKSLIPGIFEDTVPKEYETAQKVIGLFPQYTWELGCKLAQINKQISKLSLLINDWQLVPKDQERLASLPNRFRDDFYEKFKALPKVYSDLLNEYSLNFEDNIYRTKDNDFYLREVGLRDRFKRKIKSIQKDIEIFNMCSLSLDEDDNISVLREDEGPFELINGSRANCSSGIAQMMLDISSHLKEKNKRITFINLMPSGCNGPANAASSTAINILGVENPDIAVRMINVFFEVYGVLEEDDFYNESYGSQVFAGEYKSKNY